MRFELGAIALKITFDVSGVQIPLDIVQHLPGQTSRAILAPTVSEKSEMKTFIIFVCGLIPKTAWWWGREKLVYKDILCVKPLGVLKWKLLKGTNFELACSNHSAINWLRENL